MVFLLLFLLFLIENMMLHSCRILLLQLCRVTLDVQYRNRNIFANLPNRVLGSQNWQKTYSLCWSLCDFLLRSNLELKQMCVLLCAWRVSPSIGAFGLPGGIWMGPISDCLLNLICFWGLEITFRHKHSHTTFSQLPILIGY